MSDEKNYRRFLCVIIGHHTVDKSSKNIRSWIHFARNGLLISSHISRLCLRCNIPQRNKGNNKITELRTILQRESQNS